MSFNLVVFFTFTKLFKLCQGSFRFELHFSSLMDINFVSKPSLSLKDSIIFSPVAILCQTAAGFPPGCLLAQMCFSKSYKAETVFLLLYQTVASLNIDDIYI